MNKILLGLYTGSTAPDSFTPNVLNIAFDLIEHNQLAGWNESKGGAVGYIHASSCRVDANRNKIIDEFKQHPTATHLFILDDDMVHPPMMPRHLAERGLPIVTGVYFRRDLQGFHAPQLYKCIGQSEDTRPGYGNDINNDYQPMIDECLQFYQQFPNLPYHNEPLIMRNDDKSLLRSSVIPIDAAGFGCVLISREAAETLKPPYLHDEPGLNGDLAFYKKAQTAGIQSYADLSMIARHDMQKGVGIAAFCDLVTSMHSIREAAKNG